MQINAQSLKPLTSAKKKGLPLGKKIFLISMLALPILNWLVFWFAVNVNSFVLAFTDMRTGKFVFQNFLDFFDKLTAPGGEIGLAISNTFAYFSSSIFIILPIALIISFFIYKRIFMYKVFRIVFYLPAIVSGVAMVVAFREFIDPAGPLGSIVKAFGGKIPQAGLLGHTSTATKTIVFYFIWTGFCSNILLLGGAMTRIPLEVLESAKIEGCGPYREVVSIIVPLIWPTISTLIVLSFTAIFTASGPILLFDPTNEYNTTTLSFWIFKQVYGNGTFGGTGSYNLVSATGLVFTAIGVPLILFVRWAIEKIPSVEY